MDEFWDPFNDPSMLDNTYEREFGEDVNFLNQEYDDDDDDEDDPLYQIHHQQRQPQLGVVVL